MTVKAEYPMKRFPDMKSNSDGIFTPEGKQYGIGAFCWKVVEDGTRYLVFFRPDNVWANKDGKYIGTSTISVNTGKWGWDGDEDNPTIEGSVLNKTSVPDHMAKQVQHLTDKDGWTETFHGFVKKGVLEVL